MSGPQPIRVLVADDHPVVRQGLALVIGRQPGMVVVAKARNGRELIDQYRMHRPDVALVDLRMPEVDGVEAIAMIRAEFPDARLIVLTTFDDEEDIYRGLRAGAMAYLLKDAPVDELIAAIRAVNVGQKRIPPDVAAKLAERMNSPELTAREREVLDLIAEGLTNKQIGARLSISEGTVRAHVNNILAKLNVQDRTQAVTTAIKRGIVRLR